MLGAIIGDIIGSPYEFNGVSVEENEFPLFKDVSEFTDDTVMALAIADALMEGDGNKEKTRELFISKMRKLGRFYPNAGYGSKFMEWLCREDDEPINSFGDGAAMRVAPVAWYFTSLEKVEEYAKLSAEVTHNHPEGIKGAQSVAAAIYMARTGSSRSEIKKYIEEKYGYDLSRTVEDIKAFPNDSSSCQIVVPAAMIAFLESEDFESAVRKAVSIGGDTDTLGAIAGAIAEAYYGITTSIKEEAFKRLSPDLMGIMDRWKVAVNKKKTETLYYDAAYRYAAMMHEGQNRIGGEPYIVHPEAVAKMLDAKGFGLKYRIAGLFHDLFEDTQADEDQILAYGGPEVLEAVQKMTKGYGVDMEEFMAGIKANDIAMNVKAADRIHNLGSAMVADWRFKKHYVEETRKWYSDFPGWEEEMKAACDALEETIPEEYRPGEVEQANVKKAIELPEMFGMASNLLTKLDKGAFLTTKSEGRKNTMIISWGAFGEIWGKSMMMIMVRKSRYTHDILEKGTDFTVSMVNVDDYREAWDYAGSATGKTSNKFAHVGLSTKDGLYTTAPVLDVPGTHLECRIFYKTDVSAEGMSAANYKEFYADGDIHTLYFAEILDVREQK